MFVVCPLLHKSKTLPPSAQVFNNKVSDVHCFTHNSHFTFPLAYARSFLSVLMVHSFSCRHHAIPFPSNVPPIYYTYILYAAVGRGGRWGLGYTQVINSLSTAKFNRRRTKRKHHTLCSTSPARAKRTTYLRYMIVLYEYSIYCNYIYASCNRERLDSILRFVPGDTIVTGPLDPRVCPAFVRTSN